MRRLSLLAGALAGGMALASACSFPEPGLVDDADGGEGGAGGDGGGPDASDEAALVDSIFAIDGNQNVDPDGASQEASSRPDGAVIVTDAAGCSCDCDNDTIVSNDAASCMPPGEDCNDLDPFIPHYGFVDEKPQGHTGDWDCDGIVTKQYPVNVKCGLLANCGGSGFKNDPFCGEEADYVTCKPGLIGVVPICAEDKVEKRKQGCR